MSVTTDTGTGQVTVHQENGAQVVFSPVTGGAHSAPPRDIATLVKNGDGSFTFTRGAQNVYTFDSSGRLTSKRTSTGMSPV